MIAFRLSFVPVLNQIRRMAFDEWKSVSVLLATCVFMSAATPLIADEVNPNIILFVIDDLGWADLGCYGSKFHKTPNIDRLAQEGMRFTQAYAAAPVGLPTRVAIMTGRYPQRLDMTASFVISADDARHRLKQPNVTRQLPVSETTIASRHKSFVSDCVGKWHLGGGEHGPRDYGFAFDIAGAATSVSYSQFAPYQDSQGRLIPGFEQAPKGEYLTDRLAVEAQKFIAEHKSQPFFLYLPHFAVHMPAEAKPELVAKYGPIPSSPNGKQNNPVYAALLESLDDAVGRVVKTLDELNLSQRTLIVFTSDNGGVCNGNGQIIPPTSNAPLRDGMGHLYEGGLRVPFIVKWPGVIKPGSVSNDIVSCLDVAPTIAEIWTGPVSTDEKTRFDGTNLVPVLKETGKVERDALYWHFPHYNVNAGAKPGAAIRSGDWKLIEFYETGRRELFNVAKEPGEGNNLIETNPEIADELSRKLEVWRESVGAKRPTPNPEYKPNPQNEDGSVTLHSSTADVFGVMLRYEPLPNKDTLGYWVRQDDWASFEFTIDRPGRFRVIADAGCGTNGGSLVHFEVAGQALPLIVPATGHFQKFEPQDLGVVKLDKPARYTLTVKPEKKEGVAVMDLRQIRLVKLGLAENP